MERYKTYIIGDYVLIPTLKIGGAIQREFKNKFFQLDNELVLMEAKKSYESNEKKKDKNRSKRNVMKTMTAGVMVVEDMNEDTKCSKPYKLTELSGFSSIEERTILEERIREDSKGIC